MDSGFPRFPEDGGSCHHCGKQGLCRSLALQSAFFPGISTGLRPLRLGPWCTAGGRSAAAQRIALVLEKAQAIPAGEQPRAPAQVRECLTKR